MTHPFLTALAEGLAERGVAMLRYQFPYMEKGSKNPDRPALAWATVRAAAKVADHIAARHLRSSPEANHFGGRMTSQAQADLPLPGVRGLVFLGFPLHPPADLRKSGQSISPMSSSRCCSFRAAEIS